MSELEVPQSASERARLRELWVRSFGGERARWEEWSAIVGHENLRQLRRGGQLVGGVALYPLGQFWGGEEVSLAALAAVAVAPERRRQGLARELVGQLLREQRAAGVALSALYASTQGLYRSLGYEWGGSRARYALELGRLRLPRTRDELRWEAQDPFDPTPWLSLYESFARTQNGHLARNVAIWRRKAWIPGGEQVYGATLEGAQGPRAYLILSQRPAPGGYDLRLEDAAALDAGAWARVWSYLADHGTLGQSLRFVGPAWDWRQASFPEPIARVERREPWLLRVLDPQAALGARGYPKHAEGALCLRVREDELFPENLQRYRLEVQGGRARCEPGSGAPELSLSARGLASLYAGALRARELVQLGWAEGPAEALDLAEALFAGAAPWIQDHF